MADPAVELKQRGLSTNYRLSLGPVSFEYEVTEPIGRKRRQHLYRQITGIFRDGKSVHLVVGPDVLTFADQAGKDSFDAFLRELVRRTRWSRSGGPGSGPAAEPGPAAPPRPSSEPPSPGTV